MSKLRRPIVVRALGTLRLSSDADAEFGEAAFSISSQWDVTASGDTGTLSLPSCRMHDIGIRSVSSTYSERSVNEIMRLPTIRTVSRVDFTCYRMLIVISSDRSVWDCGWPGGPARPTVRYCLWPLLTFSLALNYQRYVSTPCAVELYEF